MSAPSFAKCQIPSRKQTGVALIVALILLVVMTLLGISGVRTVAMEEKMAANSYDRSLAFQAAEAGLRAGEQAAQLQWAQGNNLFIKADGTPSAADVAGCQAPDPNTDCNASGLCQTRDKDCTPRWLDANFNWAVSATAAPAVGALAGAAPRYFIEYLGIPAICDVDDTPCPRYRVTAISNPGNGRAAAMLQSIYAPL